jgi:hypothetical protein
MGLTLCGDAASQSRFFFTSKDSLDTDDKDHQTFIRSETLPTKIQQSHSFQVTKSAPPLPRLDEHARSEPPKWHKAHHHHHHHHHHHNHHHNSLVEKMKERQAHPHDDFVEHSHSEHKATQYMNALQDNSMSELSSTFGMVESMVEKGNDVHKELRRQGEVVRNANRDVHSAEKDINDSHHMLHGMKSLKGKFENMVKGKKRFHVHSLCHYEDGGTSKTSPSTTKNSTPTTISKYYASAPVLLAYNPDSGQSKQDWLHQGMEQLSHGLDLVKEKQLDIGHEIESHEKHFKKLDHNIEHIDNKIQPLTNMMKTIN